MDKAIIVDHASINEKLKDVSFTVQKGEFVGILGNQDSEKDLILDILLGFKQATSGFVSVLGHDPYLKSPDYLRKISYINKDNYSILKNNQIKNILNVTKEIYGLQSREFNKNIMEISTLVKDSKLLNSLIYKPDIVIINDVSTDLDSLYEYNNKYQSTFILLTEKIDLLVNLVRRVIVLGKGTVFYDGPIDELILKFAKEKLIKIKLSDQIDIKNIEKVCMVKKYTYPYLYVTAPRSVATLTAAELMQNFPIQSLTIEELSVEDILENMK